MKFTRPARRFVLLPGLFALAVVSFSAIPSSAQDYSHVRIVRLSFVEGTVTVQRPDITDWATAPVNTPIQEGFKLSTGEDSFAEIEFENAHSTARLGQQSLVEFTQLALAPDGGKVNRLTLDQGYATFHFDPADSDVYEVRAGETVVTPYGKTEFRIDIDNGQMRVEVLKGSVEAAGPQGSTTVAKNTVLAARWGEPYDITQGITKDAWDEWVGERDQLEAAVQAPVGSGSYSAEVGSNFYGWSDLGNYGDWGYLPGYGNVWFPGVGYGWSPYSAGRWCWYPSFGYTWISAEPWGWLPFHYGGWFFDPAFGWYWSPYGFGAWSPALVTWYQGPGWVGWAPKPAKPPVSVSTATSGTPGGAPGRPPMQGFCRQGRTCMTVMSAEALQSGKPVTANDLKAVDLVAARGSPVSSPELPPTRLASLPGTSVPQAAFLGRSRGAGAGVAAPQIDGTARGFVGKAPSSLGVPETEHASAGFAGQRSGPASGRSEHGVWGGGRSGHVEGSSHAASRASSGSSGGGLSGGGVHASSAASSSGGGGHSGGGGFSSGGGGGGGGHSGGGGGSHH